ncbi:hypothetical protein SAMN05519103_08749 [Rhizobiales bacterium GAS113]|nr:hypothetical protein SAMN05519103_08749 [Rhizobiales bacterium GAS113]
MLRSPNVNTQGRRPHDVRRYTSSLRNGSLPPNVVSAEYEL